MNMTEPVTCSTARVGDAAMLVMATSAQAPARRQALWMVRVFIWSPDCDPAAKAQFRLVDVTSGSGAVALQLGATKIASKLK
jgi:hypothetical protein